MKNLTHQLKSINEGFVIKDNKVFFDSNSLEFINTKFGKSALKKPYEGKLRFGKYYAPYQKAKEVDQQTYTEVLKTIKGQSKVYEMDYESYQKFLSRTATYFQKIILEMKVDTILMMDSSSNLVQDLVNEINRRLPKYFTIRSFSKAIFKNPDISQVYIDTNGIEIGETQMKGIQKTLDKMKQSGYFSIKEVKFVPQRKFFKNWLKLSDNFLQYIMDKNVVIIDDFVTSGETLHSASELLENSGAKSVTGLAIMKGT